MKINNKTPIPNHLIALVVQAACDFTKADSEVLVVNVNPGKCFHGRAFEGGNQMNLTLPINSKGVLEGNSGYRDDGRAFGFRMYALAVHEAQHVIDFQNKLPFMLTGNYCDKQEAENRAIAIAQIAYDVVADTTPVWLDRISRWVDEFRESTTNSA